MCGFQQQRLSKNRPKYWRFQNQSSKELQISGKYFNRKNEKGDNKTGSLILIEIYAFQTLIY